MPAALNQTLCLAVQPLAGEEPALHGCPFAAQPSRRAAVAPGPAVYRPQHHLSTFPSNLLTIALTRGDRRTGSRVVGGVGEALFTGSLFVLGVAGISGTLADRLWGYGEKVPLSF